MHSVMIRPATYDSAREAVAEALLQRPQEGIADLVVVLGQRQLAVQRFQFGALFAATEDLANDPPGPTDTSTMEATVKHLRELTRVAEAEAAVEVRGGGGRAEPADDRGRQKAGGLGGAPAMAHGQSKPGRHFDAQNDRGKKLRAACI